MIEEVASGGEASEESVERTRGLDQEGQSLYGFLPLSFEEPSATAGLGELWEREGAEILKLLMHDPRWSEIILLAARRFSDTSQPQATQLVRAILESDSEYEDALHRDLFWAAQCLGNGVRVDRELQVEIVERLCKVYFDSTSARSLCEDIRKTFALLGGSTACDDLMGILLERLSDAECYAQVAAASALGVMGERAARDDVIAVLLEHLSNPEWCARSAAMSVFEKMGERAAREDVIAALLERLSEAEWYVPYAAVDAVGSLALKVQPQSKPTIIKLVLPHARNKRHGDKSDDYRREAGYLALRNLMASKRLQSI